MAFAKSISVLLTSSLHTEFSFVPLVVVMVAAVVVVVVCVCECLASSSLLSFNVAENNTKTVFVCVVFLPEPKNNPPKPVVMLATFINVAVLMSPKVWKMLMFVA